MSARSTGLSDHEKREKRRAPSIRPLLVSRKDACLMLGNVDVTTLRRLERLGVLHPKRLNPHSATAQVFYTYENIKAAAEGAADA